MTHFTVGIIVPSHELSNSRRSSSTQMAPYDESTKSSHTSAIRSSRLRPNSP